MQSIWQEFISSLLDCKDFQKEIDEEKQILANSIMNIEKYLKKDEKKEKQKREKANEESEQVVENKPNIEMVVKKFINFLSHGITEEKNNSTIITLLKIMGKIITKESDEKIRKQMQTQFNKLGATRMYLVSISKNKVSDELVKHLLIFGNTLLQGGNINV